jgi:hypothetical protein
MVLVGIGYSLLCIPTKKPQIKAENEHEIVFILKDIPSSWPHLTSLGFRV